MRCQLERKIVHGRLVHRKYHHALHQHPRQTFPFSQVRPTRVASLLAIKLIMQQWHQPLLLMEALPNGRSPLRQWLQQWRCTTGHTLLWVLLRANNKHLSVNLLTAMLWLNWQRRYSLVRDRDRHLLPQALTLLITVAFLFIRSLEKPVKNLLLCTLTLSRTVLILLQVSQKLCLCVLAKVFTLC